MSSGADPFMVGASEEIGSQGIEDPWLLGRRPLTASLRLALPMGGRHPVGLNSTASHCRYARHAAAIGDPAIVTSARRASGRERSHGRKLVLAGDATNCRVIADARVCHRIKESPNASSADFMGKGRPALAGKPRAGGETRHRLLRRPSACLGPLRDPTIVKCGRDFLAPRWA
jgi:hypothetical protein